MSVRKCPDYLPWEQCKAFLKEPTMFEYFFMVIVGLIILSAIVPIFMGTLNCCHKKNKCKKRSK